MDEVQPINVAQFDGETFRDRIKDGSLDLMSVSFDNTRRAEVPQWNVKVKVATLEISAHVKRFAEVVKRIGDQKPFHESSLSRLPIRTKQCVW